MNTSRVHSVIFSWKISDEIIIRLFLYLSQGPPKSYSPLKKVIRLLSV